LVANNLHDLLNDFPNQMVNLTVLKVFILVNLELLVELSVETFVNFCQIRESLRREKF